MTKKDRLRALLAFLSDREAPRGSRSSQTDALQSFIQQLTSTSFAPPHTESGVNELIERQIDEIISSDIDFISKADVEYPKQLISALGASAPPFLFFKGNRRLFDEPSIGFCGSRHASPKGLEVCADIVAQLVELKHVITAGYAAGVDQLAHRTALDKGGSTIAVLAEGILNFSVRQLLHDSWNWDRALVVSEYLPSHKWTIGRAMTRNRTILGLSRALIVIEARSSGGTLEAGKAALALKHPLYAPTYESIVAEGNDALIKKGAVPLHKSKSSGRANLGPLLRYLAGQEPPQRPLTAEPS